MNLQIYNTELNSTYMQAIHETQYIMKLTYMQAIMKLNMWSICSKPVASRIFDFLSMMHHLKEKEILFTMTQKLSLYLKPNQNYE